MTDKEELNEIETVAKVFVVEERMKDLTYDLESKNITDPPLKSPKKIDYNCDLINKRLPIFTVRGLN